MLVLQRFSLTFHQVDPNNEPHVGGNTWAGGTGGRDTAGLGGKGGPYRLDAGHDVFQLSDEEKNAVPEEVMRAARGMGQKAFKERLRILSEHTRLPVINMEYFSRSKIFNQLLGDGFSLVINIYSNIKITQ